MKRFFNDFGCISYRRSHRRATFRVRGGVIPSLCVRSLRTGKIRRAGDVQRAETTRKPGIGTVNGLYGEMIALDGQFFQIRTDGKPMPSTI